MKKLIVIFFAAIALSATAQTKEITILSVNDIHAAIERFPQLSALLDSTRNVHPDLLLFSGGDNRTGNPINDQDPVSSRPIVTLMNAMKFNASAIGNHEFDGGIDGLRSVINNTNFHYLCANMYPDDTLRIHTYPYQFFYRNGVRICVLGLIQVGNNGLPDCDPSRCENITFRPIAEVAREYAWLRSMCDVLILLTHNGYESDIQLANAFPEADIIIGGHSHTAVEGTQIHNGVLITQAERWLKYVTQINVKVKDGKVIEKTAHLIDVKNYPRTDEKIAALLDGLNNNPTLKRVLTQVEADFVEKEELGSLMTDAIKEFTDADIAIQNSGGVRIETLPKGDFTVADVYRLDPFGNEIIVYNLTGEEVVRMVEAASHTDEYGPAYVSGITYSIQFGKGGFSDVKELIVKNADGSDFDLKRKYKVVTNRYLASVCVFEKEDEGQNLFTACSDALIQYLEKRPSINYNGVKRVTIK